MAGILLAICAVCRGGALLLAPGFALAALVGVRAAGRSIASRVALFAAGGLLLILPYAAARASLEGVVRASAFEGSTPGPQHHAVWYGVWTGLGDFDRSKGYRWEDHATVNEVLKEAGGTPMTDVYDSGNESILQNRILSDIRSDPWWYARILAARFWATVSLRKLWPWGPLGGLSVAPRSHPNEGAIDEYYRLTATADVFGVGRRRLELPVALIVAPLVVFVLMAPPSDRARLSLACISAGVLAPPVLLTTASAIEPQAILILYLTGAAFLFEDLQRRARRADR